MCAGTVYLPPLKGGHVFEVTQDGERTHYITLGKKTPQTHKKILLYVYHVLVPMLGVRVTES